MLALNIAIALCFIVKIYLHLYLNRANEKSADGSAGNEFYYFEYLWFYTMPVTADTRTQKLLCNLAYFCFLGLVLVQALLIWVF